MAELEGEPISIDGVKVGEVQLSSERRGREVIISAKFKVDWPGLWHAAARSLDKGREQ